MSKSVFITGTDTGVGKTWFTLGLLEALKKQGLNANGMKPVASGGSYINGKLINDDARLILQHSSGAENYEHINPYVFEAPVSPNIAARQANEIIELQQIVSSYNRLESVSDNTVVEGVGGWRVPIYENISTADMVRELGTPVILVVGLRLGCINHAILTAEAIKADGIDLCGWVSNQIESEYLHKQETLEFLTEELACPNIANIDYMVALDLAKIAKRIDPTFLLGCEAR